MAPSESEYPQHPRLAVGAIVFKDEKILLVKRGSEPAKGQWAIPGGNVKLGESLQSAAQREILEETGIVIKAAEPVYTFETIVKDADGKIRFHYVVVDLAAQYLGGKLRPGDDATQARWLAAGELEALEVNPLTLSLLRSRFNFGD